MIGSTIGNYVVRDKIGEGGMGVVYVAEHPRIGRKVAIKVLLPEYSQNPEVVARFFTEARASSAIKNEHIIDIIDFGELPDKSSYIIMEWLEGQSLTQLLEREGRVSQERALHIARGIGRALQSAHSHNIVHRDLKPDNIFLVTRGDDHEFAKVLDFGIAKLLGNEGAGAPVVASKTRTGAIIGTPIYMSPEQCRGVAVDERSDIYSLGIIVYQMLCGQVPFAAEGLGELLLKHMTEAPRPPRELQPLLAESVERAVLMALEKDPAKRHRNVADFIAALGGAFTSPMQARRATEPVLPTASPITAAHVSATDTIGAAVGETMAASEPRRRSGGGSMYLALAAILLIGGGGAAFMLRENGKTTTPDHAKVLATATPRVEAPPGTHPPVPRPSKPRMVRLEVRTATPGAKIEIDGQGKENFYSEELLGDGRDVRVVIRAPGYERYDEIVKLDRPITISESLLPSGHHKTDTGTRLPAAPKPYAKPEAKPDGKSDVPKPGHDADKGPIIYKGTKSKLDTSDPYAQ